MMSEFKTIGTLCLLLVITLIAPNSYAQTVKFEKMKVASESYEAVAVVDINGNGHLDLISGEYWYEGPDFKTRHFVGPIERRSQYWDDFAAITMDVNGNGYKDIISGGWFSESLHWRENPGDNSEWEKHIIEHTGNVEAARGWDVDGDGHIEVVPNNPNDPLRFYKLNRDEQGRANGSFREYYVADSQGHGLGFGDINGNGRGDFVISNGWLEAPADLDNGEWILHDEFNFGSASVPILVVDVNGNGKNDLIVGQAHDYGLSWYEQTTDSAGNREWIQHPIDPFSSQFHTMEWVDIDGDGNKELITGKRFRAHNGNDPGAYDPLGLYYFKWNGVSFVKNTIASGALGVGKGTGIHFSVSDLNQSGKNDIVVAGKDGLYIFFNLGID